VRVAGKGRFFLLLLLFLRVWSCLSARSSVQVILENDNGEILLQQRSHRKDIAPVRALPSDAVMSGCSRKWLLLYSPHTQSSAGHVGSELLRASAAIRRV
jgi:hypothetical protein